MADPSAPTSALDAARWPADYSRLIDPAAIADPALAALKAYWDRRRGARRMPRRADIDVLELREHVGNLFLFDVLDGARDFRFRLIGTSLVLRFGRDSTGRTFSETYRGGDPQNTAWLLDIYRTVALDRVPVLSSAPLRQVDREFIKATALHLPLSDDGETVNMILGETQFHHPAVG